MRRQIAVASKFALKLHTDHVAKRGDVMRLTFRHSEPCSVQQREPADDCRQQGYYIAFGAICKYSIVTKMDNFFCQNRTMKKISSEKGCFLVVFT